MRALEKRLDTSLRMPAADQKILWLKSYVRYGTDVLLGVCIINIWWRRYDGIEGMAVMAKHKRVKKPRTVDGEVYMTLIDIDGKSVIKIGTTNRSALKRALEIAEVIHGVYKFIPKMQILINERTHNNYVVEAALLKELAQYKYEPLFEFDGCSELVDCDTAVAISAYRKCMDADYPAQVTNLIEI